MTERMYSRDELMEHLKGTAENSRTSPMQVICAEAYDEIDKLVDAVWEYGQHRASCRIHSGKECDCGFFEILKTTRRSDD